jgi:hypothetical protein
LNLSILHIHTCIVGSLIEAHLFGSMEEDEECNNDHTLINDSSAQGGDKEQYKGGFRRGVRAQKWVGVEEIHSSHW